MRDIDTIIVHCSDTRPNWMEGKSAKDKMAEITRWHIEERGWRDNGYAYGIDRDGTIVKGRDLDNDGDVIEEIGAHTKGHNRKSIGVVLFGGKGCNANDDFEDHFTEAQDIALRALIDEIQEEHPSVTNIKGHNDFAARGCPGFSAENWFYNMASKRTSIAQSKTIQASQVAKVAAVASPAAAAISDVPWQTIAVLGVFALIILAATGLIDLERLKKWRKGDR